MKFWSTPKKVGSFLLLFVKMPSASRFPKPSDGSLIWNIPPRLLEIEEAFWTEYNAAADLETKEALLRKYMKGSTLTRIIRKVNPILQKTGLYSVAGKMYKAVFVKK